MKQLSLLALMWILTLSVWAQYEKGYVFLKDGSVLKGKYAYSEDLSQIKINSAGNLWIFDYAEVDSVVAGRMAYKKSESQEHNPKFFFHSEMGFLLGNDANSQTAPFCFSTSLNYRANEKFGVGLGLGLELLDESYMPVYANFMYKLRDAFASPFLFLRTGYQVPLEDTHKVYNDYYYRPHSYYSSYYSPSSEHELSNKGGYLINFGVGYQRMYSSSFGITVSFGYQHHRLHYEGENEYALDMDYNRLSMKLGILFN